MEIKTLRAGVFGLAVLLFAAPVHAAGPQSTVPTSGEQDADSLTEMNKKLTNPVSSIWSLQFQQNNLRISPGPGEDEVWSSNLIFQPVMPVGISDAWNLITRPVLPLVASVPHPGTAPPSDVDRAVGFGDTTLLQLISPGSELVGNWLLGAGPSWIFPSASSDFTGQGKYQVGPGVLVGYLSEKWILGALVQNWWSFAGDGDRAATRGMNLQPIAAYFLPRGWSVGYSGNILADWNAPKSSNKWTVPIGIAVNKVQKIGKLPVKFSLAGQWMPVQPQRYGQTWNLQLQVTPVIPKLIRGNLAEPSSLGFGLGK